MVEEQSFTVAGKTFACQLWHPQAHMPLLALHGWLDNSASFDFLAPLLTNHRVVAPDLAGHGLTDHRSLDSPYNIWQDVGEIHALVQRLGWERFSLVGHSRGAAIASLFAGTFPDKVAALVMLDGFLPETVRAEDAPLQLARAIADKERYVARGTTFYPSLDDAIAPRLKGPIALSRKAALAIARRGVGQGKEGFYWRADHRLRGASEVKLTLAHTEAFVKRIDCPSLLMLAGQEVSPYHRHLLGLNANISVELMNGGHHLHMEESVGNVADVIRGFLHS